MSGEDSCGQLLNGTQPGATGRMPPSGRQAPLRRRQGIIGSLTSGSAIRWKIRQRERNATHRCFAGSRRQWFSFANNRAANSGEKCAGFAFRVTKTGPSAGSMRRATEPGAGRRRCRKAKSFFNRCGSTRHAFEPAIATAMASRQTRPSLDCCRTLAGPRVGDR